MVISIHEGVVLVQPRAECAYALDKLRAVCYNGCNTNDKNRKGSTMTITAEALHVGYTPEIDEVAIQEEVDQLFSKTDKEIFEVFRRISDVALEQTVAH